MSRPDRLRALLDHLTAGLVGRHREARLALLALLAGEHLLLIGPPGTAKSLVARRLVALLAGARGFERLLTRFSVPEELFGPYALSALEQDRYERQTAGYLPDASVAFLDEIFKANSAVLNALLTLLAERRFHNGTATVACPLVTVIGASNEQPEGAELAALHDRFLLRAEVRPLDDADFRALLHSPAQAVRPPPAPLTAEALAEGRAQAAAVSLPAQVEGVLVAARARCAELGLAVSDRRWRQVVGLLRVSAWSHRRPAIAPWDCWLLPWTLATAEADRAALDAWLDERLPQVVAGDPQRLEALVQAWAERLAEERAGTEQAHDAQGRPLYVDHAGQPTPLPASQGWLRRDGEPLYVLPPPYQRADNDGRGYTEAELATHTDPDGCLLADGSQWVSNRRVPLAQWIERREAHFVRHGGHAPLQVPRRLPPQALDGLAAQVSALAVQIQQADAQVGAALAAVPAQVGAHLWLGPAKAERATAGLSRARAHLGRLATRAAEVAAGVRALPRT